MAADFLSRNVVEMIQVDDQLEKEQQNEEWIKQIKAWMLNGTECTDSTAKFLMKHYWANNIFIEDNVLWVRIKYRGEPSRVCLVLSESRVIEVLKS